MTDTPETCRRRRVPEEDGPRSAPPAERRHYRAETAAARACVAGAVLGCDHDCMAAADCPARRRPRTTLVRRPGPEHARGEISIEGDVAPTSDHLRCRPPWREDFGPDWTRFRSPAVYTRPPGYGGVLAQPEPEIPPLRTSRPPPPSPDLLDYLDDRADPVFGDNDRVNLVQLMRSTAERGPRSRTFRTSRLPAPAGGGCGMLMPSTPLAYPQVVSRRFACFRV